MIFEYNVRSSAYLLIRTFNTLPETIVSRVYYRDADGLGFHLQSSCTGPDSAGLRAEFVFLTTSKRNGRSFAHERTLRKSAALRLDGSWVKYSWLLELCPHHESVNSGPRGATFR